jgi:Ca-activated chloride channel family protein
MSVSSALRVSLLLLGSCTGFAQQESAVFQVETRLQSIAVQVTVNQEQAQGLSASDFTLLENGRPQKIAFFGAEYQPVSLAVLVDSSVSMESSGKLDQARAFLAPLIRGHRPEDEIFLLPFDDQVGTFERLTPEQRLRPLLARPARSGQGGTALYDALASALCRMRAAQNIRQAIVVITDGADQHSRLKLEELIDLARSSNAQIFTVGFYDKAEYEIFRRRDRTVTLANGHDIDNPVIVFERLSRESGAESFFPSSKQDFQRALDRIAATVEAQYTLAYYPESSVGLRKIEVKVNLRGARLAARRTVGSDATGEVVQFSSACTVSAKGHPYPWESRITLSSTASKIYHETFSDPASGWPNRRWTEGRPSEFTGMFRFSDTTGTTASLRYVPEGYELSRSISPQTPGDEIAGAVIAAYGPAWVDFRASVVMEGNWGASARSTKFADSAGMVFNVSTAGYYAFLLGVGEEFVQARRHMVAYALVKKSWDGPAVAVVPWTVIPPDSLVGRSISATAETHTLSVENHRGQITLLVDGLQVERVRDTTLHGGYVGFGVFGKGRAIIRDLLVEELP